MPDIFRKFDELTARQVASQSNAGGGMTHVQPGAGSHEPSFRNYWLFTAWLFLAYQGIWMGVLVMNVLVGSDTYTYPWFSHIIGTLVLVFGTGFMACIYRLILFPQPTYYSSIPNAPQSSALAQFHVEPQEAA